MKLRNFLLAAAVAAPLIGGGFVLQVGDAQANPEAIAKKAVLVARVAGCHDPAKAEISGTAEFWANGKRESAPLTIVPLDKEGTVAIRREWPASEARLLKLTAKEDGMTTTVLVRMDGDSFSRSNIKYLVRTVSENDLAPMLAALPH